MQRINTVPLSFVMDPGLRQAIRDAAEVKGVTSSIVIRVSIMEALGVDAKGQPVQRKLPPGRIAPADIVWSDGWSNR
jgi:hypothetical protein